MAFSIINICLFLSLERVKLNLKCWEMIDKSKHPGSLNDCVTVSKEIKEILDSKWYKMPSGNIAHLSNNNHNFDQICFNLSSTKSLYNLIF